MLHEPCGLVGDFQRAVQLVGAKALLAARHQMRGLKPLVQLHMAALENGADCGRKFALAGPTTAQTGAAALHWRNAIKAATARAEGPCGHTIASSRAMAAASLWKWGWDRKDMCRLLSSRVTI